MNEFFSLKLNFINIWLKMQILYLNIWSYLNCSDIFQIYLLSCLCSSARGSGSPEEGEIIVELFLTLPNCAVQTFPLLTFVLSSLLHLRLCLALEEHWDLLAVLDNHQNNGTLCHLGQTTKPWWFDQALSGSTAVPVHCFAFFCFVVSHSHFLLHMPPFPRVNHFWGSNWLWWQPFVTVPRAA